MSFDSAAVPEQTTPSCVVHETLFNYISLQNYIFFSQHPYNFDKECDKMTEEVFAHCVHL